MAGEFEKLVETGNIGRAVRAFEMAIARSFISHDCARTQAEVKRRFDLCAKVYRILVHDKGWAVTRALEHVPQYLKAELDGLTWEPEARMIWPTSPDADSVGG